MEAPRCYWGIHRGAWKKHRSGVYSNQMPNPYGGAKDMAQPPIGFRGHIPAGPRVPAGARKRCFLHSGSHGAGVPAHDGEVPIGGGWRAVVAMRTAARSQSGPPGNTERPLHDLSENTKSAALRETSPLRPADAAAARRRRAFLPGRPPRPRATRRERRRVPPLEGVSPNATGQEGTAGRQTLDHLLRLFPERSFTSRTATDRALAENTRQVREGRPKTHVK